MSKVNVVYWSQSGNTQAMAEAVGKGAADAGAEVSVVYVGDASVNDLKDCKAFALGCPAVARSLFRGMFLISAERRIPSTERRCISQPVSLPVWRWIPRSWYPHS